MAAVKYSSEFHLDRPDLDDATEYFPVIRVQASTITSDLIDVQVHDALDRLFSDGTRARTHTKLASRAG